MLQFITIMLIINPQGGLYSCCDVIVLYSKMK